MAQRISSLLKQIQKCTLCAEHLPLGARPIVKASAESRILIVGQAPGRRVHETGIPFNDPSGERLRGWMGVDRDTFYDDRKFALIPMGFCYPGTGKSGDLPPRPECADTWREQLLVALPNIEFTLVIGQYAQAYHLAGQQGRTLTETVAQWRDHWPELLPMPHPSPRNNRWLQRNPWFEQEVIPELRQRVRSILGLGNM